MQLVPTHCDDCARSELVEAAQVIQGHARCTECGGAARTLPGESYSADDDALFRDLDAALQEAAITPQGAGVLAAQLESRHHDQPGRALHRLAQSVPALGILELVVLNQPGALRKAEGMLATLLEARAHGRRNSGFMTRSASLEGETSGGTEERPELRKTS